MLERGVSHLSQYVWAQLCTLCDVQGLERCIGRRSLPSVSPRNCDGKHCDVHRWRGLAKVYDRLHCGAFGRLACCGGARL